MSACTECVFWEPDYKTCICPIPKLWYICPIETGTATQRANDDYRRHLKEIRKHLKEMEVNND